DRSRPDLRIQHVHCLYGTLIDPAPGRAATAARILASLTKSRHAKRSLRRRCATHNVLTFLGEMTRRIMIRARSHLQSRFLLGTDVLGLPAAGTEPAPRRRIDRAGH